MSGGKNMATSETKLEALKIQSSAYGVVIPVVGGVNRVAGNLIDYLGFKATPQTSTQDQGGKGGGVKTTSNTYTYSASVLMGICQGPIGGISRIWKGKEVLTGGWAAANIVSATETYAVPASGAMTYTLANGATLIGTPTITTTITVTESYGDAGGSWTDTRVVTLASGTDYSLSAGVVTVLDAKWRGFTLTIKYQRGSGAPSLAALTTLGLSLAAGDMSQTAPAWLTALDATHSLGYPGLAFVHGQDYDLGTGASVDNHSFEVQGAGAYRYGSTKPDCNPAEFTAGVLTDGRYGARMPAAQLEVGDWTNYCAAAGLLMSPLLTEQQRAADFIDAICKLTNSAAVWSVDTLKIVPYGDVTLTGNGVTYTPNTTPIYDLDDDRWLQDGSEDPIVWTDKAGADRYNVVKVEYCDRTLYYAKTIATAQDDADIATNGTRTMPTFSAPWICDAGVARLVAQILLQRSLLIGRTATLKLPWAYCLLEPMDLVTVSDTLLNDSKLPVRITKIEEDEESTLTVEIEDWPLGAASPTLYTSQVPGGYLHDYRAAPGSVAAPVLFEAPAARSASGLAVCAAVKGTSASWGGCTVWMSLDGTTYKRVGSIAGGARYGTLSAAMTATATACAVTGLGSAQLISGSAVDAAAFTTLCYIGGASPEYISHQTATLTGAGAYSLSGCVRGGYGVLPSAHSTADPFVRVDDAVFQSEDLDPSYIGRSVYFKFTSFNIMGGAEEDISTVTAYSYALTGRFYQAGWLNGGNLLTNPSFLQLSTAGWALGGQNLVTAEFTAADRWSGAYKLNGSEGGFLHLTSTTYAGTSAYAEFSTTILPAVAGRWYQAQVLVQAHRSAVCMYVAYYNAAGSVIGYGLLPAADSSQIPANGTRTDSWIDPGTTWTQAKIETDYARIWGNFQAPAGCTAMLIALRMFQKAGLTDQYLFAARAMLCEVGSPLGEPAPFEWGAGALRGLQAIGTTEMYADAATEVYSTSVAGVSITGRSGVPTGSFTDIIQIGPFTPSASGKATLTIDGNFYCVTPASGTSGIEDYAFFSTRAVVNGTQQGPLRTYHVSDLIGFSKDLRGGFGRSVRFDVVGGTAYTVILQGQKFSTTASTEVVNCEARVEVIKR